jgi:hypothetical protein
VARLEQAARKPGSAPGRRADPSNAGTCAEGADIMPRGGARKNGGRKPKLTVEERLAIGARCESRQQEAYRIKAKTEIAGARRIVSKEWAKAKAVPVSQRKRWIDSEAGREHLEDVEYALREDQGISPDDQRDPVRLSRIEIKRPKGLSTKIICEIANRESEKRKTHISEHMVERCWTEFRKFEKSLNKT